MPLNWKRTLLPAALALALVVPASAYAADQTDANADTQAPAGSTRPMTAKPMQAPFAKRMKQARGFGHGALPGNSPSPLMIGNSVNQHKYVELLAEAYSPSTLADWKAALAEQDNLRDQQQALLKDQGVQDAIQAQKKEQLEKMKAKREELKNKVESGDVTKEQVRDRWKAGKLPFAQRSAGRLNNALPNNALAAVKDNAKHWRALTDAVKADDASAIGAALAPLLEDLQKTNESAAARIGKLKPNANGQPVQPKAKTPKRKPDNGQTDNGQTDNRQPQNGNE